MFPAAVGGGQNIPCHISCHSGSWLVRPPFFFLPASKFYLVFCLLWTCASHSSLLSGLGWHYSVARNEWQHGGQPMSTPLDNSNSGVAAAQSVRKDTAYLWAEEKEAFPSLKRLLRVYSGRISAFFYSTTAARSTVNHKYRTRSTELFTTHQKHTAERRDNLTTEPWAFQIWPQPL